MEVDKRKSSYDGPILLFNFKLDQLKNTNAKINLKILTSGPCEVHKNKKPKFVTCERCQKTLRRENINNHMYLHSNERPFKCNLCSKSYCYKHSLKRHNLRLHEKILRYFCETCEKGFYDRYELKNHLLIEKKKNKDKKELIDSKLKMYDGKKQQKNFVLTVNIKNKK